MRDLRLTALAAFLVTLLLLSMGAFAPLWIEVSSHEVVEGTPGLQLLWAGFYVIVALLLIPCAKTISVVLAENKSLALLLVLCLVSAAWFADPAVTLRKSAALIGTSLLGLLLALRFDLRGQLCLIAASLGIAAIASLIAALFFPSSFPATEFAPAAWNGIFSHKNLLGRSMCLGTLAFLSLERRGLQSYLLSFIGAAFCFAMLLASHSQTALIVLLAMLLLMAALKLFSCEWRRALGSALLLLVGCLPLVWIAIAQRSELAVLLGRNSTMTGRTRIWEVAALSIAQRPWLGYGYGAFWWVASESRQAIALIGYPTPHAHNGFLDLALQLGFVGLVAFAAVSLFAFIAAVHYLRSNPGREAQWPLLYLVFTVLYSFSESSLLAPNSLVWILFIASCASILRRRQVQRQIVRRIRTLILTPVPLP